MSPSIPIQSCSTAWLMGAFADEAGESADEQVAALQAAGIKRIDLRTVESHNITQLPLDTAEAVAAKLEQAGITVAYFGSPIGKIDIADDFEIDMGKLEHLGQLRPIFGCNHVRLFSYYNRQGASADQWREISLDRLGRLRDRAVELGLVLVHENERDIFGDRCSEVQVLAAELRDAVSFKLIFDFDNYHQSGDDVWDNWQKLQFVTDAFHLKDSDAEKRHVPIGQGEGQVRRILEAALAQGWTGMLSLEPHLTHSGAVARTSVGGKTSKAYEKMTPPQCFQTAAAAAIELLSDLKAPLM